jgi:hypothetical protein
MSLANTRGAKTRGVERFIAYSPAFKLLELLSIPQRSNLSWPSIGITGVAGDIQSDRQSKQPW